jgi:N-acetylmuramoyl-L-alanine amidase
MQIITILNILLTVAVLSNPGRLQAKQKTVALSSLAKSYKLISISQTPTTIRWKTEEAEITFNTGSRKITFNNNIFWLNGPIEKSGKQWSISQTDADSVIRPLLINKETLKDCRYNMVILDPGHGGKDCGGIGCGNTTEKTVVLDIAKRVRGKLVKANIAVKMTRTDDTFIELEQRPKLASDWNADIFVSIHANKAGRDAACGVETFVIPANGFCSTSSTKPDIKTYKGNKNNSANTILAGEIHKNLLRTTKTADRGVKRARFMVLKDADCPAVLVEIGFLTNKDEAQKITTSAYRNKIADGIATGIISYIKKVESSQTPAKKPPVHQ